MTVCDLPENSSFYLLTPTKGLGQAVPGLENRERHSEKSLEKDCYCGGMLMPP